MAGEVDIVGPENSDLEIVSLGKPVEEGAFGFDRNGHPKFGGVAYVDAGCMDDRCDDERVLATGRYLMSLDQGGNGAARTEGGCVVDGDGVDVEDPAEVDAMEIRRMTGAVSVSAWDCITGVPGVDYVN